MKPKIKRCLIGWKKIRLEALFIEGFERVFRKGNSKLLMMPAIAPYTSDLG
ncbi:MAG: hypothetical protein ACRCTK_03400 [Alphaproteobacteria bacterium]